MRKPIVSGLFSIVVLLIGAFAMCNSTGFAAQWYTAPDYATGVAIGDLWSLDGFNEIAFAHYHPGDIGDPGTIDVYDPFGTLIWQWEELNYPTGVAIGDYDNDGRNDFAWSEEGTLEIGLVRVYGMFNDTPILLDVWTTPGRPSAVAIGDCDNDGLNELAYTESTGRLYVYRWPNTLICDAGGFSRPYGVAIGDYDNDGLNELALTEFDSGTLKVFKWQNFPIPVWTLTAINGPRGVAIGDYDNDGLNEIAFVSSLGDYISVWLTPPRSTIALKILAVPDHPWGVAIGDYNADGCKDLTFTWDSQVIVYRWGDLGSPIFGTPTFYEYDDEIDGIDLALFIQCYKGLAPPEAMYLADIGGGLPPRFFAFDGKVDGMDLALFIQCYKGLGP